jgi:hypothetical protein
MNPSQRLRAALHGALASLGPLSEDGGLVLPTRCPQRTTAWYYRRRPKWFNHSSEAGWRHLARHRVAQLAAVAQREARWGGP